jgi:hypothetical protein
MTRSAMPRRTIPHPQCQPFVHRQLGVISIAMPVIRPDGNHDLLMKEITPKLALAMAAELLAGASAAMPGMRESCEVVASNPG